MIDVHEACLAEARSWIGTPYQHQASRKGVGADCLGLLIGVWRAVIGTPLGPSGNYTPDWAEQTGTDTLLLAARQYLVFKDKLDPRPGEVMLFRYRPHFPVKHVALYAGDNWIIHAYSGACVCETPLTAWWQRRFSHLFQFPCSKTD